MYGEKRVRKEKSQVKFDVYSYISGAMPRETDSFLVERGYSIPQSLNQRILFLKDYATKFREKGLYEITNALHPDKDLVLLAKKEDIQSYANACGCMLSADGEKTVNADAETTPDMDSKYLAKDDNKFSISRDTATLIGVLAITGLATALIVKSYK